MISASCACSSEDCRTNGCRNARQASPMITSQMVTAGSASAVASRQLKHRVDSLIAEKEAELEWLKTLSPLLDEMPEALKSFFASLSWPVSR